MLSASLLRGFVLIVMFLNLGGISAVTALYARAYAALAKDVRSRHMGLTPLHVVLVSAGVLVIEGALTWALITSLTTDLRWDGAVRTGMYGLGSALILAAMVVMGRMQTRRKVQFERCQRVTVQHVDTTTAIDRNDTAEEPR